MYQFELQQVSVRLAEKEEKKGNQDHGGVLLINYSEKWDEKRDNSKYITFRIPKLRLPLILGMWLGIGALFGYMITDYVYAANMVC